MTNPPQDHGSTGPTMKSEQRQLDALSGLVDAPFDLDSQQADGLLFGPQTSDGQLSTPTAKDLALPDGQTLIPGLRMGQGYLPVWSWSSEKAAPGWELYAADLTLDAGRPFGILFYRRTADGVEARVGVRWDFFGEELQCPVLDRHEPRLAEGVLLHGALHADQLAVRRNPRVARRRSPWCCPHPPR